jgi:F0F1-type ATP synthase membrane subunit c/vacuolar-type H+-ATPase subunit K
MWCWYWDRFGSLITAVARNPSLTKQLFSYSILGFVTEAIALFTRLYSLILFYAIIDKTDHDFVLYVL